MSAICPCTKNDEWFASYTICKTECPSTLSCFGYSECTNLDRRCD